MGVATLLLTSEISPSSDSPDPNGLESRFSRTLSSRPSALLFAISSYSRLMSNRVCPWRHFSKNASEEGLIAATFWRSISWEYCLKTNLSQEFSESCWASSKVATRLVSRLRARLLWGLKSDHIRKGFIFSSIPGLIHSQWPTTMWSIYVLFAGWDRKMKCHRSVMAWGDSGLPWKEVKHFRKRSASLPIGPARSWWRRLRKPVPWENRGISRALGSFRAGIFKIKKTGDIKLSIKNI